MNESEIKLLKLLGQCYNDFVDLDEFGKHPNDVVEFATNIHTLQRLVMARSVRRNNPDIFKGMQCK